LRVAALQMCSGTRPEANLDVLDRLVGEAVGLGASYVLSPEMTVAFAENRDGLREVAHPWEGNRDVARAAEIARGHGVFLHLGSLAVALEGGHFANRSVLFTAQGEVAATYDKIHLFDATLPGIKAYRESETYRGGDRAVVTSVPGFRLGMTICYDVRFAPLYSALASAGAEVIAVPAAFTVPTGEAHWETLVRARAIETGCYVVAAAQGGQHENGRSTWGRSMIVDPWGRILAAVNSDKVGVIVGEIDVAAVSEARGRVPSLANSRQFSLSVDGDGASSEPARTMP
jgi:deaminated glutathione amidase